MDNDDRRNISVSGIGFFDVLLLINIVLKLTGVINWSWWVVLWPLWFSIITLIFVIFIIWYIVKRSSK